MKTLPEHLVPYRQTPEFTDVSVPSGLLHVHSTKAAVWGKIIILAGHLTYRILEPVLEAIRLSPGVHGVIEPTVQHEVVPQPGVRFYVEFYRPAE